MILHACFLKSCSPSSSLSPCHSVSLSLVVWKYFIPAMQQSYAMGGKGSVEQRGLLLCFVEFRR
jgi:hypothetical protein